MPSDAKRETCPQNRGNSMFAVRCESDGGMKDVTPWV